MEETPQNKINSINERVFIMRDYGVPLFATTLSLEHLEDKPFVSVISELFLAPENDVIDFETWRRVNLRLTKVLPELVSLSRRWHPFRPDFEEFYFKWEHWIEYVEQKQYKFAIEICKKALFASTREVDSYMPFYPVGPFIPPWGRLEGDSTKRFRSLLKDIEIDEDKFFRCMKINQLLITSVTDKFEERFNELMRFDVPFSLSPKIESFSLEKILRDPKKIVVLTPTVVGLSQAVAYMYQGQNILALQVAATGAGVSIILLCPVALTYLVMSYLRGRRGE